MLTSLGTKSKFHHDRFERSDRTIMSTVTTFVHWFNLNPFSAVSVLFGVATLLITLYTYVYDYRNLPAATDGEPGMSRK